MANSIKRTLLFTTFCIMFQGVIFGQGTYLKAADDYFVKGDFYSAAQLYEKWLNGKTDDKKEFNPYTNNKTKAETVSKEKKPDVQFRLAASYYKLHQFAKAAPLFKASADEGNTLAGYYYGKSLKYEGQAEQSKEAFQSYMNSGGADAELMADAGLELKSFEFSNEQKNRKDLSRFVVQKQAGLNGVGATYAPSYLNSALVFTSTRTDAEYDKKNPNANKLYTTGDSEAVQLLGLSMDKDMEQGISSFNPSGSKMYFTKWTLVDGRKMASLYTAEKQGQNWGNVSAMPEVVNMAGFSSAQPFVTSDGKHLFFSSDRPGGMGKKDIWYVTLDESGNPSGGPVNLKAVNSAGDDETPFYHTPYKALVFSSNGRIGMGGYDLYISRGDLNAGMQAPVNMGLPVNSIKDDMYYVSSDAKSVWNNAYLSSDRSSECCLELFAFDKMKVKKLVTGKVVDCKSGGPVAGATVSSKDASGKVVYAGTTDANGNYSFLMDDYSNLQTSASAEGYDPGSMQAITPTDIDIETFTASALCINKIKPKPVEINKTIVLENVLYEFNKAKLSEASLPVFDTLISWMNEYPEMQIELSAHTDDVGTDAYNQALSEKRAQSCVDYLVSKGIAKDRIIAKGYGESQPIAPNRVDGKDNPDGRKLNRRTEFKVLKY